MCVCESCAQWLTVRTCVHASFYSPHPYTPAPTYGLPLDWEPPARPSHERGGLATTSGLALNTRPIPPNRLGPAIQSSPHRPGGGGAPIPTKPLYCCHGKHLLLIPCDALVYCPGGSVQMPSLYTQLSSPGGSPPAILHTYIHTHTSYNMPIAPPGNFFYAYAVTVHDTYCASAFGQRPSLPRRIRNLRTTKISTISDTGPGQHGTRDKTLSSLHQAMGNHRIGIPLLPLITEAASLKIETFSTNKPRFCELIFQRLQLRLLSLNIAPDCKIQYTRWH